MNLLNQTLNQLSVAAADATTTAAAAELTFEPQRFIEMLGYMGKGMVVIFVLIGVIILVTMLINKIFSKKQ